jgi:hypothetical protein
MFLTLKKRYEASGMRIIQSIFPGVFLEIYNRKYETGISSYIGIVTPEEGLDIIYSRDFSPILQGRSYW